MTSFIHVKNQRDTRVAACRLFLFCWVHPLLPDLEGLLHEGSRVGDLKHWSQASLFTSPSFLGNWKSVNTVFTLFWFSLQLESMFQILTFGFLSMFCLFLYLINSEFYKTYWCFVNDFLAIRSHEFNNWKSAFLFKLNS